jgi:hypothetical protein
LDPSSATSLHPQPTLNTDHPACPRCPRPARSSNAAESSPHTLRARLKCGAHARSRAPPKLPPLDGGGADLTARASPRRSHPSAAYSYLFTPRFCLYSTRARVGRFGGPPPRARRHATAHEPARGLETLPAPHPCVQHATSLPVRSDRPTRAQRARRGLRHARVRPRRRSAPRGARLRGARAGCERKASSIRHSAASRSLSTRAMRTSPYARCAHIRSPRRASGGPSRHSLRADALGTYAARLCPGIDVLTTRTLLAYCPRILAYAMPTRHILSNTVWNIHNVPGLCPNLYFDIWAALPSTCTLE